jgi:SulP family sulfate permease
VRYIPVTIIIGFTNGIAVLIALSQLRDLFGPVDRQDAGRLLLADRRIDRPHRQLQSLCPGDRPDQPGGLFLWPRLWATRAPIANAR